MTRSQPSVSDVIGSLERELETKLFERLGNSVTLTIAAKNLLAAAETILRRIESCSLKTVNPAGIKTGFDL